MEQWDIYDQNRHFLNKTMRRNIDRLAPGEYHLSADVWMIDRQNRFLIQKRSSDKKTFPALWQNAAGGAVWAGESTGQAAVRKTAQELGIVLKTDDLAAVGSFTRGQAIVDVYLIRLKLPLSALKLQTEEASDAGWVTLSEIENLLHRDRFSFPVSNIAWNT